MARESSSTTKVKATESLTYEQWFTKLIDTAKELGMDDLIDRSHPDSYKEYFDDGDAISDVIQMEAKHSQNHAWRGSPYGIIQ